MSTEDPRHAHLDSSAQGNDPLGIRRRTTSLSAEAAAVNNAAVALANAVDLRWSEEFGVPPDDHVHELVDAYRNACSEFTAVRRFQ